MKKIIMSLMALLCAATSFAQYHTDGTSLDESSVYYGARLGMNLSTLTGDIGSINSKAGLVLAGIVGLRVSDETPLFIESGLYFSQRGAKKDKLEYNLDYFEVPVLIKYGFPLENDFVILPHVGPTFSLGIAGKTKIPMGNPDGTTYNESSYSDHFSRLDMGIKFGCGVDWKLLYLEAGYQLGIANISKLQDIQGNDYSIHNSAFYLNFGVNF